MFTGARFPDSCSGTSNPFQQLTVNVLADLESHQQPKIAISGYFTWETTMTAREIASNVPGLRRISAQTVRNRLREKRFRARRPYFDAVQRRWHRLVQQSKGLGPVKLEASLIQRWIKIDAAEKIWPYTCLQPAEWEVRKELRPWGRQFRRRKCDGVGAISYARKTQLVHIYGDLNAVR